MKIKRPSGRTLNWLTNEALNLPNIINRIAFSESILSWNTVSNVKTA